MLAAVAWAEGLAAQVPPDPVRDGGGTVLSGGLGFGTDGAAGLLAMGIPAGSGEVVLRVGGTFGRDQRSTLDVGALYGKRAVGAAWWARLAGGLGFVSRGAGSAEPCPEPGAGDSPCDRDSDTSLSVLAQADAVLSVTARVGLGVAIHGAVGGASYVGVSLGLYLGGPGPETAGR